MQLRDLMDFLDFSLPENLIINEPLNLKANKPNSDTISVLIEKDILLSSEATLKLILTSSRKNIKESKYRQYFNKKREDSLKLRREVPLECGV